MNKGQPRKLDDWGVAARAWGWGASRALDYFETDKAVDARRVGVEGHSRWGKAALVAMAYDERFAIGYISSSGAGGAKLHRRKFGELIENVAAPNEYHWMAGNYLKYGGRWDSCRSTRTSSSRWCAPRPVFLSAGNGPTTNPDGTIKMLSPGDPNVSPEPRSRRATGGEHQRRVGRCQGHVPRWRRREPRLPAARQEGSRHD